MVTKIVLPKDVPSKTGYAWIKELLVRAKDDSLNIKDEEFETVMNIIDTLEKESNNNNKFKMFFFDKMSLKQAKEYILYIEK